MVGGSGGRAWGLAQGLGDGVAWVLARWEARGALSVRDCDGGWW